MTIFEDHIRLQAAAGLQLDDKGRVSTVLAVSVHHGTQAFGRLAILYAGQAPGLVTGVMQISSFTVWAAP